MLRLEWGVTENKHGKSFFPVTKILYIEIMVRVAQLEFMKNCWLVHLPWAYANYTSIKLPKPFPKDF